ncbi:MAG TPA: ribosomal protein S18-alanine N-acetyltransferase [Gemmatimonadaceae bacterium]|jgi:ribosomal-protein-alanine N-acetyltransferase
MTMTIREAERTDLGTVTEIERVSFSDPWTRAMFTPHLAPRAGAVFLVAEESGDVVGYALTQSVMDESELLNIAVAPTRRNRGVGARLLDAMLDRCKQAGAAYMWLEVRASNAAARALYESRGFVAVGLRRRYYQAPREDAIVLRVDLRVDLRLAVRNELITEHDRGLAARRDEPILSTASNLPRQEPK